MREITYKSIIKRNVSVNTTFTSADVIILNYPKGNHPKQAPLEKTREIPFSAALTCQCFECLDSLNVP